MMKQSPVPAVSNVPLPASLVVPNCQSGVREDRTQAIEVPVPTLMHPETNFEAPVTPRIRIQLLELFAILCRDNDTNASDEVNLHRVALHQREAGNLADFWEGGRTKLRSTAPCFMPQSGVSPEQQQEQAQPQPQKRKRKQKQKLLHQQTHQAQLPRRQASQLRQIHRAAHHCQNPPPKPGNKTTATPYKAATSRPPTNCSQWTFVQKQTSENPIVFQ
mmetsp:Transcript_67195/g.132536  ORF Transcript_67195/g.132536 Transcript_67195/m.132536 type:complete len:218 (+) Transcript_67195:61-714(+)